MAIIVPSLPSFHTSFLATLPRISLSFPRISFPFTLLQASIEVPLPFLAAGKLRGDVLEAVPGLLFALERLGDPRRVSVAHGAIEAQRYRGKAIS